MTLLKSIRIKFFLLGFLFFGQISSSYANSELRSIEKKFDRVLLLFEGILFFLGMGIAFGVLFWNRLVIFRIIRRGKNFLTNRLLYFFPGALSNHSRPYLTVFGFVFMADGWGKIGVEFIQTLKNEVSINFVRTRGKYVFANVPQDVKKIIKTKNPLIGKVALFTDCVWDSSDQPFLEKIKTAADANQIRIAYSMFETTKIPPMWTSVLNRYFDAVAVPDPFLVGTYRNSGVNLPIFTLPLNVNLSNFWSLPLKNKKQSPMVFADFSVFAQRKNHLTLIRAFAQVFGNNPNVMLRLNGRSSENHWDQVIRKEIQILGLKNVRLTLQRLLFKDYLELFQTIDCYITLSKGEGFSIPPREAMALGIPVICADNTALNTICQTGLVRSVPALSLEPAYYHWPGKYYYGNQFNCTVEDAANAMKDVFDNYDDYLNRAQAARQWTINCNHQTLMPLYRSLIKPSKVILGAENHLTADYLMTNSRKLYQKYL
ncbi:MAG: glycosyltransferase [Chlamydiota bacterium]